MKPTVNWQWHLYSYSRQWLQSTAVTFCLPTVETHQPHTASYRYPTCICSTGSTHHSLPTAFKRRDHFCYIYSKRGFTAVAKQSKDSRHDLLSKSNKRFYYSCGIPHCSILTMQTNTLRFRKKSTFSLQTVSMCSSWCPQFAFIHLLSGGGPAQTATWCHRGPGSETCHQDMKASHELVCV